APPPPPPTGREGFVFLESPRVRTLAYSGGAAVMRRACPPAHRNPNMKESTSAAASLERLPSGMPGLDKILGGGFFRAGVYIVQGMPGSGKTIFANQVCYSHVAAGGSAVYMTLLAESHARMLQHIRALSF